MAVGALQHLAPETEALAIAAGGSAFAPGLGDIQTAEGVNQLGQCLALGLLAELPVGHFLDLSVGDAVGQPGHRVGPDVAAVGDNGGQDGADLLGFPQLRLGGQHKVAGEVQFIVHLYEQLWQLDLPQMPGDPRL